MPDPHLRRAMKEIRALLKRYRIGGHITLVSKTHAEFATEFPHWSVVQWETGPGGEAGVRVRSFRTYYRTKAEQQTAMEESLHCLFQIRDIAGQTFVTMDNLCAQVKAQVGFDIEHHPFTGFEPNEDARESS